MAKAANPKRFVTFLVCHTETTPATILEARSLETGETYKIADIPERTVQYQAGQTLEFGSVNAARDFARYMGDKVRQGPE